LTLPQASERVVPLALAITVKPNGAAVIWNMS
jgi:hypothetical protein